mgnify:CR=1 FL=1
MSTLDIKCNNVTIEAKSHVKYLGAVIDQDMSGRTMCTKVIKKVNSVLMFFLQKKLLPELQRNKTPMLITLTISIRLWILCVL